jgi:5-methylcytosine-specific restriction enzyme subunit McrC
MNDEGSMIPIRNVYALLAYAWGFLNMAAVAEVGEVDAGTPANLLARLLADGLKALLRRGPYRAYVEQEEDLRLPRGAVDITRTVTSALRARGRLGCRFDELSYDVPENRVLKATARILFTCRGIDANIGLALRDVCFRMEKVADVDLTEDLLDRVCAPRGHRLYGMLFDVCRMVRKNLLPEEAGEGRQLRDFTRDDDQMAYLFEAFVRGFLRHHLDGARVQREHLRWADASGEPAALRLLPLMKTDVSVRTPGQCTIVETKFVRRPFRELEGGKRLKLRSDHLYQLFAYVKNTRGRTPASMNVDGVLLYASVGRGVSETLALGDGHVSVQTLDLSANWFDIRAALLTLPLRRTSTLAAAT